jgi:hypothetical protein
VSQWRPLSAEEISQLTRQGCTCSDWSEVQAADGFHADRVRASHFSGPVKLGVFDKEVSLLGGMTRPTGIYDATIHNCVIGDNVTIRRIANYIANYTIENDAVVHNVDLLAVEGESTFGNGITVAVVNEAGGREVPIYDTLSAQIAYVMAFYRHRRVMIEKLSRMIQEYAASVKSPMGRIGKGARIVNSRIIKNVKIGPAAIIQGADRLENGSVNSCSEDPTYIGPGVTAEGFIVCSGSRITDGAILRHCFVGQGTVLAEQYSAENSMFFANCDAFRGEACAVFAGPCTVTHHKSTLLIAGLFSFFNAGSGTNQSNHMYKLGPVHQGIVERGSKTGSSSYLLWPARIGAFTVVTGRHYHNVDTSDLPFSYLIEQGTDSVLLPGANLRNVGVLRDARKWPPRDRRKDPRRLDRINFELLSPYTVQKMIAGRDLLRSLMEKSVGNEKHFSHQGVNIPVAFVERGIKLYQNGIDKYVGGCLVARLQHKAFQSVDELRALVRPDADDGPGQWVDLAGMLAPKRVVDRILDEIENGGIASLDDLDARFASADTARQAYQWAWAAHVLHTELGKTLDSISAEDLVGLINRWKEAAVDLDQQLCEDAKKEFSAAARVGYGLDADPQTVQADFEAVRGSFESNDLVNGLKERIAARIAFADELIGRIRQAAH